MICTVVIFVGRIFRLFFPTTHGVGHCASAQCTCSIISQPPTCISSKLIHNTTGCCIDWIGSGTTGITKNLLAHKVNNKLVAPC